MVQILGYIIQDFILGGLIFFISPILTYWDIFDNIFTDVIYTCRINNLLDIFTDTHPPLLYYTYYFSYLQKILKSFFAYCNFITLSTIIYTWNLIEICKSAYLNNV